MADTASPDLKQDLTPSEQEVASVEEEVEPNDFNYLTISTTSYLTVDEDEVNSVEEVIETGCLILKKDPLLFDNSDSAAREYFKLFI